MGDYKTNYDLVVLLGLGFRTMIDDLHNHLATVGYEDLRPVHGFVFQRIAPDGATATDIARFLDISKQAASEMVDYLEQHGYVIRQPDPQDKRGKIITLTERGWSCIHEAEATMTRLEGQWAALIGPERMAALYSDLRHLVLAAHGGTMPSKFRPVW